MARAANALAARAGGAPDDILAFVHQDARLLFDATVALPRYFAALPEAGVLGFCGSARQVAGRQWHKCPPCFGELLQGPEPAVRLAFEPLPEGVDGLRYAEVQALDGYALFLRRATFDRIGGFDEGYDGWHGYDLDLCTAAMAAGYRNYAIGEPSRHDSWGSAGEPLARALDRHAQKWSAFLAERNRRPPLKIHVYAIAKDEAKFAERFAASCADADGVHVLDTGSTDATVEILRARGVHVEQATIAPWRFDVARNRSLELVPGDADVCLSIDLDEVLVPGWRAIVEDAWTPGTTHLGYRYAWSFRDGRPHHVFRYNKCHSRRGYVWMAPVHEAITPVAGFRESHAWTDAVLVHHHPDPAKSRAQYLPLLELAVREDGNDVRSRFYLGREYTFVARWQDAIDTLERYLAMPQAQWAIERSAACQLIAASHERLRDAARAAGDEAGAAARQAAAFKSLLRACHEAPDYREAWAALSDHCRNAGDDAGSYWAATKAMAIVRPTGTHLDRPDDWSWRAHDLLSLAAWQLGRRDESLAQAFAAVEAQPDDERLVANARIIQLATAPAPPMSGGPIVDVVILAVSRTPDAYAMTKDAIASLRASSPEVPARFIVVETHEGLRDEPWVRDEAELFGAGVTTVFPGGRFGYNRYVLAGFAHAGDAGSPYAMVLNNDVTLFAPGFLRAMLDGLQRVPSVSPLGYREARWNGIDRSVPLVENYFVGSALSGWCVMFDRAIRDDVPIEELFPPDLLWYRQDVVYGEVLARHGLAHGCVTAARALHLGARSHRFLGDTIEAPADRATFHWTFGVDFLRTAVVGNATEAVQIAVELAAYRTTPIRATGAPTGVDDRSLDRAWFAADAGVLPTLLRAWEPKVARGGWLAGSGYDDPDVRRAVDAFSRELLTPLAFVTRDGKTWAMQAIERPMRAAPRRD
jgi:GT2 family glycosyltransferase